MKAKSEKRIRTNYCRYCEKCRDFIDLRQPCKHYKVRRSAEKPLGKNEKRMKHKAVRMESSLAHYKRYDLAQYICPICHILIQTGDNPQFAICTGINQYYGENAGRIAKQMHWTIAYLYRLKQGKEGIGNVVSDYEQGKKDGRKQTLSEVLKEYKRLIDKAPTISHKDSIDFGCWLEQKIKAME